MQLATSVSMTDTQLVSAAKPSARKNTAPTTRPTPPIAAKTFGRLMNVRLGRCHAVGAEEDIDGGDDHQSCEERDARVENFDLVVGLVEVDIVLDVAAVGDHDAHADTEREEELTHRVERDVQKALDGQAVKSGLM